MGASFLGSPSRILTRAPLALLAGLLGCVHQVTQEPAVRTVNPLLAQGVNVTGSIAPDSESPDLVRARAVVANNGDHPVRLSVGSCPLIVRAYMRPEASGYAEGMQIISTSDPTRTGRVAEPGRDFSDPYQIGR
jgi:hypothetical protein